MSFFHVTVYTLRACTATRGSPETLYFMQKVVYDNKLEKERK